MSASEDMEIVAFVSENTDPAKSVEARYLDALRMFAARSRELHVALDGLAHAADTAELLLRPTHPGEAASLHRYVALADRVLKKIRQH